MPHSVKLSCQCDTELINCGFGCMRSCRGCVTGTGRPGTLSNGVVSVPGEFGGTILALNWQTLDQRQKQIQNVVRVPSSEYTMNKGAVNAAEGYTASPNLPQIPWNQSSDRFYPAGSQLGTNVNVSTRGNSTLRSITRLRPNASSAPSNKNAQGVDIKHNSYARYLNRLKGKGPLKAQQNAFILPNGYGIPASRPEALKGAKNAKFSIIAGCRCDT